MPPQLTDDMHLQLLRQLPEELEGLIFGHAVVVHFLQRVAGSLQAVSAGTSGVHTDTQRAQQGILYVVPRGSRSPHTPFDPARISRLASFGHWTLHTGAWCLYMYARALSISTLYGMRYLGKDDSINYLRQNTATTPRATPLCCLVESHKGAASEQLEIYRSTRWAPRSDRMGAAQFAAVGREYLAMCGSLGASQTSA